MVSMRTVREYFLKPLVFSHFDGEDINKFIDLSTNSGVLGIKTLTFFPGALSLQGFLLKY